MQQIIEGCFLLFLIVIAVKDIKTRTVSPIALIFGGMISITTQLLFKRMDFWIVFGGAAIGAVCMMISKFTKEGLGYGDSLVILILGTYLGFYDLLLVLSTAFFLLLCVSIPALCIRKMSRKYALPFLPFLTCGYILLLLAGGMDR